MNSIFMMDPLLLLSHCLSLSHLLLLSHWLLLSHVLLLTQSPRGETAKEGLGGGAPQQNSEMSTQVSLSTFDFEQNKLLQHKSQQ